MKYSVRPTTKFQKDLKRVQRRGYDLSLLTDIIKKLAEGETCQRGTRITVWLAIILVAGNVISRQTGC